MSPDKKPPSPSRVVALECLAEANRPLAPGMDVLLEEQYNRHQLQESDRALARELVFGVLRSKRSLIKLLDSYMRQPMEKQHIKAYLALLIGVYQAVLLDRIPSHAVVDETVRLVAIQHHGNKFKGLANAIMRRVVSDKTILGRRVKSQDWQIRYSIPQKFEELMKDCFNREGELQAFFEASNEQAPLCLRLRGLEAEAFIATLNALDETLECKISPDLADCVIVTGKTAPVFSTKEFQSGLVTVEDEGAQLAAHLGAPDADAKRIWDLCAAPGGKTSLLADAFPDAEILATDVSEKKLEKLSETLTRLNLTDRIKLGVSKDIFADASQHETFDAILIDAPCSGLGTLRRHPEIRYRRTKESLLDLQAVQLRLLKQSIPFLKSGGVLSFIVCSITNEESHGVVQSLLNSEPSLEIASKPEQLPFKDETFRLGETGFWRLTPHEHHCDGFFVARFRKK